MIGISRLYCGTVEASDSLRYRAAAGGARRKPVVVWNCTRRCNLRCAHCYSQSLDVPDDAELSTDEGKALLDDLAAFKCPAVLFSGGEPLLRPDLPALIAHARANGLRAVLSTNGTRITPALAEQFRHIGLSYVGVSLDGIGATNDAFRGLDGAFQAALAGIRCCIAAGMKVGLRLTLTRHNVTDLDAIFALIRDENIPRACFYHLVLTGRGAELAAASLSHDETRRAVDRIIDWTARLHAAGQPREILTVDNHADGPYLYLRMLRQRSPRAAEVLRLLEINQGSGSGSGIGCVSWDGSVHPDQFWRSATLGNVREGSFSGIWSNPRDPLLAALRDKAHHVTGRCASCRFLNICGGNLRARAQAIAGDPWASDPGCYLSDQEIAPDHTRDTGGP